MTSILKKVKMILSRVERVTKHYDKQGRIFVEEFEYFYPEEVDLPIGFKSKKK